MIIIIILLFFYSLYPVKNPSVCSAPEISTTPASFAILCMLHGKASSRHLLKLGADRLVDLEELGDAAIDTDSLALVQVTLDVSLGDALLVARADDAVCFLIVDPVWFGKQYCSNGAINCWEHPENIPTSSDPVSVDSAYSGSGCKSLCCRQKSRDVCKVEPL